MMRRMYLAAFINAVATIIIDVIVTAFPFAHPLMVVHHVFMGIVGSFLVVALLARLVVVEKAVFKTATLTNIVHNVQEQVVNDYNRLLRIKGEPPIASILDGRQDTTTDT